MTNHASSAEYDSADEVVRQVSRSRPSSRSVAANSKAITYKNSGKAKKKVVDEEGEQDESNETPHNEGGQGEDEDEDGADEHDADEFEIEQIITAKVGGVKGVCNAFI
jgi:hypothetical protein